MAKRECSLCRENKGVKHLGGCFGNKGYNAQLAWNKKMARIMAHNGQQPIPEAPDYSIKALEKWTVTQSVTVVHGGVLSNMWWRSMYALLEKEPKSMTGFSFMPKGDVE